MGASAEFGIDMKLLASSVTDDADFGGERRRPARPWKGRQQIEAEHAARLGQFSESVWSTKAPQPFSSSKPDVALVHVDWGLKGDRDADGTPRPPRGGVFTWVVVKQGSGWLIRAAQNTNLGPNATQPTTANK